VLIAGSISGNLTSACSGGHGRVTPA